jgi:hypothetical protein
MNRRLTPLALAAAIAGTNLGQAVAGGGELLRGGLSQAALAPGDRMVLIKMVLIARPS